MKTINIELPEELITLLGGPEAAPIAIKRAIILELVHRSKISRGKGAEVLGMTLSEFDDLMEHGILHNLN